MAEFALMPGEITFEVLLRDPYYIENKDTPEERVVPIPSMLSWGRVEVKYQNECEHETTVCESCANEWEKDHYIRITARGELLYISPDYPTSTN